MKTKMFSNVNQQTLLDLVNLSNQIEQQNANRERQLIDKNSPYSKGINKNISSYEELCFYCNLGLAETFVTRPVLIREINLNLYVSSKNKTNLELMQDGKSPYAFDGEEGQITLHHMGQDFNGPLVELTQKEHMMFGNNSLLHREKGTSWRNTEKSEQEYEKERAKHWRMRTQEQTQPLRYARQLPAAAFNETLVADRDVDILSMLAGIFAERSASELYFLSESARLKAVLKEFGVCSVSEFAKLNLENEKITCTSCGSPEYSLYGTYDSNGETKQKYQCSKCGKIFTVTQRSIISESKLSFATWINLIICLYHGLSVEETARICGISAKSVQNNRLRLFYALKILDDRVKLTGEIVVDDTYFPLSFKGNRTGREDFTMTREARKRGTDKRPSGLSKEQVCVIFALDENGKAVAKVAGAGAPNYQKFHWSLRNNVSGENITCIYSDKSRAIKRYAKINGYDIKQLKSSQVKRTLYDKESIECRKWLQKINSCHSKCKKYLSKFAGMSSDLLQGYVCLFTWRDRNKENEPIKAYEELFSVMTQPNLYKSIDEISTMLCFRDVNNDIPNKNIGWIEDLERAKAIYAKRAMGVPIADIMNEYGISRARIYQLIQKIDELGYGYKTEKEKAADMKLHKPVITNYPYENDDRNKQIYQERMAWRGPANDFYEEATQKYGLSKQTVKNIVSEQKRIIAMSESLNITQTFEYKELSVVYKEIYAEYTSWVKEGKAKMKVIHELAIKHNYSETNIKKIISEAKEHPFNHKTAPQRLTKSAAVNRDKEIYVAFLQWPETRTEFTIWASEKYGLSYEYISKILRYHFKADPKRYEQSYHTFVRPQKE